MQQLDVRNLRKAFGRCATGVTVVTSRLSDIQPIGVTANSFTSMSISPALVSWNYRSEALGFGAFLKAPYFAIRVLGQCQAALSPQFAASVPDRFAGVDVEEGIGGVPLIKGCGATFECRQWSAVEAGDHVIIIGEVLRYTRTRSSAACVSRRRLSSVARSARAHQCGRRTLSPELFCVRRDIAP
jgi:3-hydroxy-9,10-secoandrosta-1,3,5(10)-triene-9,17-dione monooxygenase reductase component